MDQSQDAPHVALTTEIIAAYVAHNSVRASELPELISSVYAALAGLGQSNREPEAAKPVPAVPVKKSITPDHLISLEDGQRYKVLKRHLSGRGMKPADYRAKWGLPADYPMVAPNYAAQRCELARSIGLGRKGGTSRSKLPSTTSLRRLSLLRKPTLLQRLLPLPSRSGAGARKRADWITQAQRQRSNGPKPLDLNGKI